MIIIRTIGNWTVKAEIADSGSLWGFEVCDKMGNIWSSTARVESGDESPEQVQTEVEAPQAIVASLSDISKQLRTASEQIFVSPKGRVSLGNCHFRTPKGGFRGSVPPSLVRTDAEGKRHELSDEEILKPLLVDAYTARVESGDESPLGELADGFTLLQAMGQILTTPTKCKGETEFTPGLSQIDAVRVLGAWMMGED